MTNSLRPPAHLEPYVRVLGTDLAIEFLLSFGGAELYLSPIPRPALVWRNWWGWTAPAPSPNPLIACPAAFQPASHGSPTSGGRKEHPCQKSPASSM